MKSKTTVALSICAMLILTMLAGCGQTSQGGAEPVENTATLTPTVVCETDSYKLTANSMEVDKYGQTLFNFTFENKTEDAEWNCIFDSVYFNEIKTFNATSELNVTPGESVPLQFRDYGFYGDVIGINYIDTIDIDVMIYDGWSNASPDAVHGVYRVDIDNTSTLPPMGDFVQAGSMEQTVVFENEYACVTAMDFDPEFPDYLMTTTPCLILRYENLSDIPLCIDISEDFAVNGVPMGHQGGAICDVLPHMTAYKFWDDSFSGVRMDEFDIDEIETFEFTMHADEASSSSNRLDDLIHEHIVVNVK